jgi:hypothetical protein
MHNGSLDAEALVFLLEHTDSLNDSGYCNRLISSMVAWLKEKQLPAVFKFKGKTFERERDLDLIARYYISLARNETEMSKFKELLPVELNIEYCPEEMKKKMCFALAEALGCQVRNDPALMCPEPDSEVQEFRKGSSAEVLIFNYGVSLVKRYEVVNDLVASSGFPPFHLYDDFLKERLKIVQENILRLNTEVEQRKECFLLRLRYDFLLAKIESLETV